jgi:RHS repeat-associated protein
MRYRFTGKEWDENAQMYYFPYRYYSPGIARWITRDPAGMVDGPNLYAYVTGNPVTHADPSGLLKLQLHGNWCGPGWTGGRDYGRSEWNLDDPRIDWSVKDSLDRVCQFHDVCRKACRASVATQASLRDCYFRCDRASLRGLGWLRGAPRTWPQPPTGRSSAARAVAVRNVWRTQLRAAMHWYMVRRRVETLVRRTVETLR